MTIANECLFKIVAKASFLLERLEGCYVPEGEGDEKEIERRLKNWREAVAANDEQKWYERLELDELDLAKVQGVLGTTVRLSASNELPTWALVLEEVMEEARSSIDNPNEEFPTLLQKALNAKQQSEKAIPFEEIILLFLKIAHRRIDQLISHDVLILLTEEARMMLEYELLNRIAFYGWQTLYWEFSIFRSTHYNSISYRFKQTDKVATTDLYNSFIRELLSDGLVSFFLRYPVLGRLLCVSTQMWIEATAEFLIRLHNDLPRIATVFHNNFDINIGQVQSVQPGLSDPHNQGRMVTALTFQSGLKLVYKPRSLKLDKEWYKFLDWFNCQQPSLPLKVIEVMDCGTHGWAEFVSHKPAESQDAVRRYYQRVGIQIALLYILNGTDFHMENIIACAEQPVLIDLEMLLQHQLRYYSENEVSRADIKAQELVLNSVIHSGLLPRWSVDNSGSAFDLSGLGSAVESKMPEVIQLEDINSDNMQIVFKRTNPKQNLNTLILNSTVESAIDYCDEIISGFERTYKFLMNNLEKISNPNGPLRNFKSQKTRFVYRPTQFYAKLLQVVKQPRYLKDGIDFSIALDILTRHLVLGDTREKKMWPLLRHERDALERLDIPIFHAYSDKKNLVFSDNEVIEDCFLKPSDSLIESRLQQLSVTDCHHQIEMIRSSLYVHKARHSIPIFSISRVIKIEDIKPLGSKEFIDKATEIAEKLQHRAIWADDGSATWLGLEFVPGAERWQLKPLGHDLYSGSCGVALFLAMLEKITGDRRFHALIKASLVSLQKLLRDPVFKKNHPIGGAIGIGAYLYSIVRISQMLDEDELIQDAERATALLDSKHIEKDTYLDIVSGTPGTILGLLALHQATGYKEALKKANICGQHLVRKLTKSKAGPQTWRTSIGNGHLLTGFSHGAAGNAFALLRLYEATNDAQYKQAAIEAMNYERSVFSQQQGNWPDFRGVLEGDQPRFIVAWCHGAAGIGLARLGGLSVINTPEVHQDIDWSIKAIIKQPLATRDHLCCGTLGLSDILLSFSRELNRPELEVLAQRQATWVIQRAQQKNYYTLLDIEASNAFIPGMFQGLAGVGYVFLRLAKPDEIPSILLWQ